MDKYRDVGAAVAASLPSLPLYIHRPQNVAMAAKWFKTNFKGNVLYAVKTNPHPAVVKQLWDSGIKHFDVASIPEIELVKSVAPDAKLYFMHPVKPREAIADAYFKHGVKTFSLDSYVELEKILAATNYAKNLRLMIRIAVNSQYAEISLNNKFGIACDEAAELLKHVRKFSKKLGICFHVGSQSMHPDAFSEAIEKAGRIIEESGVKVDIIDVGGGFPSVYPGMNPPDLGRYMQTIHRSFMKLDLGGNVKLWCEPGRALVAESGSLVVRVDLRKDNALYINDGTYGGLFDAGQPQFIFPTKMIRSKKGLGNESTAEYSPFIFYGPTCDSIDMMKGPFMLPSDIQEGDYIEIGQMGAYSLSMRSDFNGFGKYVEAESEDSPIMSIFNRNQQPAKRQTQKVAVRKIGKK